MSNMLQAVSILYKTRLPLIVVFNKIDVVRHEEMMGWMEDFEKFHEAVDENPTFASDLSRSLSLVLDAFYKGLRVAGVSAMTGEGMEELFEVISRSRKEYVDEYLPELVAKRTELEARDAKKREENLERLRRDVREGGSGGEGRAGREYTAGRGRVGLDDDDEYVDAESIDDGRDVRRDDARAKKFHTRTTSFSLAPWRRRR